MGFEKGNKLGGRTPGSKNKVESKTKIFLKQLMDDQQEKIERELQKLEGKAYLDAVNTFLEYSEPKLSRTEVKAEVENTTRRIGFNEKQEEDESE